MASKGRGGLVRHNGHSSRTFDHKRKEKEKKYRAKRGKKEDEIADAVKRIILY